MIKQGPTLRKALEKVLIVEDNPLFARQIRDILMGRRGGHQIIACQTGAAALEVLGQPRLRLDLALIDIGLPDMSGLEIIRALRHRFEELPILVISVISSERTLLEAIRAGAHGYILKGDSETAMAKSIDDVLEGNYPISPALARSLFKLAGAPIGQVDARKLNLSPREFETLKLLSRGHSYKDVAQIMNVKLSTVQTNIRNLYRKLQVNSQTQAVIKARDAGLIP